MIYRIDNCNEVFKTLKDAKDFLSSFTRLDFKSMQLLGTYIEGFKGNDCITLTPINGYENGRVLYGKTYNIVNKIARLNKLIGGTETRIK